MAVRNLHAVNDNGEVETVESLKAELARHAAEIKGLQRDLRGWMVRYRQLEEDKAQEAREHVLWPLAKLLFVGWQRMCRHGRCTWQPERFWLVEPFLTRPNYATTLEGRVILVCRAIKGAQFDAWTKPRKNGTVYRRDAWEAIFEGVGSFEDFRKKAPVGWEPRFSDELRLLIVQCEKRLERMAEVAKLERKDARS